MDRFHVLIQQLDKDRLTCVTRQTKRVYSLPIGDKLEMVTSKLVHSNIKVKKHAFQFATTSRGQQMGLVVSVFAHQCSFVETSAKRSTSLTLQNFESSIRLESCLG